MTAKRRLIHVGSAVLITVGLGIGVAAPLHVQAATVDNDTFPINFGVTNPCNGENVALSGTEHDTLHITMDSNGGFHGDMQANLENITGVGDQGNTYVAPGVLHSNVNGRVGGEETFTETFNIISAGSAPNFILHEDYHITVNADGTVTTSHDNVSSACRG
jgi:hypothetical protein